MVAKVSAGLLLYRLRDAKLEVLLVHPGGPFWRNRDLGAWSIPKGETVAGEDLLAAALREFHEETGVKLVGTPVPLPPVRQRSGKLVHAFALEGDLDAEAIASNTFAVEWPPRSDRTENFPEVDRASWFDLVEAKRRILPAQAPLLDELAASLALARSHPPQAR